jgi:hypothetical protein
MNTVRAKDLKVRHKEFLNSLGMDKRKYLFVEETADNYRFMDRKTHKILDIRY